MASKFPQSGEVVFAEEGNSFEMNCIEDVDIEIETPDVEIKTPDGESFKEKMRGLHGFVDGTEDNEETVDFVEEETLMVGY